MSKKNKPDSVSTALTLLWISLAVGVLNSIINFSNSVDLTKASGFGSGFVIFVTLFTLVFMAFFIYLIGEGKNWARITFLVLYIIGIPFSVLPAIMLILTNPISAMFTVGIGILELIALIFLFQKTSSDWFHSMKK
ncbi:MAG TPA: hypothetical protein VJI15_02150 [Candidatus Nanoarchaeia archaeon]|nr:hypothetical protein [Candidatus Nanoarchaeia archaeon]